MSKSNKQSTPIIENIKSPDVNFYNKLTLAWITYPIVALFFIILRAINIMNSIQPLVDQIKNKILLSCNALESSTSALVNLPNLMITEFNKIISDHIDSIIGRFLKGLDLAVYALEEICIWLIITFKSTYRCLLQLAISSSLNFQKETITKLQSFVSTGLNTIKSSINGEIDNYNKIINDLKQPGIIDIPNLQINSLGQLDTLQQFPLSNDLIPGVDLLNNNSSNLLTFTFDEIENKLTNLTSIPFELLRTEIKNSAANVNINRSVLPQASLFAYQDITFCKDNLDLSILDNIASDLIKISYIGIGLIALVIIILIAINVIIIRYNHKKLQSNINRVSNHLSSSHNINKVNGSNNSNDIDKSVINEIIGLIKSPLLTRLILRISKFFKSLENKNLVKWFFYYISHKPAIICLIIGISGVLTIYLQLIVLAGVKARYKAEISTAIGQFSDNVINMINTNLESKSKQFSNQSNTEITNIENVLNGNLFGWSNTTITTLNSTLNTAVDDVTGFINNLFKDVPLISGLVLDLLNCIILVKIRGIQTGLTFIKDNSFIDLPRVNDTILMINTDNIKSIVDKDTSKFLGGGDGDNGIDRLFNVYEKSLLDELTIYWTLIAIYFVVIIMGIAHVIYYKSRNKRFKERYANIDGNNEKLDRTNINNDSNDDSNNDSNNDTNSNSNDLSKKKTPLLPPKPLLVKR